MGRGLNKDWRKKDSNTVKEGVNVHQVQEERKKEREKERKRERKK